MTVSRSLVESALLPSRCDCARVTMMRGDVVSPGMVSTEPDDRIGSPVDGPALEGSGAVISIDGHRLFVPYGPTAPTEIVQRIAEVAEVAQETQQAVNHAHTAALGIRQEAIDAAVEAATEAALGSAAAAGIIVHPADEPLPTTHTGQPVSVGQLLYQVEQSGGSNGIVGVRIFDGAQWLSYAYAADHIIATGSITGSLLSATAINGKTISGATLNGATINGGSLYSPGRFSVPRVQINSSGMEVIRGSLGDEYVSASLGGSGADQLTLYNARGLPVAGLSGDGSGQVQGEFSAGSLRIAGRDFADYLDAMPKGIVTYTELAENWHSAGTSAVAGPDLRVSTSPDRLYRVVFRGVAQAASTAARGCVMRIRLGAVTSTADPAVDLWDVYLPPNSNFASFHAERTLPGPAGRSSVSWYFTYENLTKNEPVRVTGSRWYPAIAYVEDLGRIGWEDGYNRGRWNLRGTTPYDYTTTPGTGTQPVEQYVRTYTAKWTRSWRGGSTVTDSLHHGYYDGIRRYSMVGFDKATIDRDLLGATIHKVEVRLKNVHTYYGSGMTAYIGRTSDSAAPPSFAFGGDPRPIPWGRGQDKWVTMPAGWFSRGYAAITLGNGASIGEEHYGKFSILPTDCQLRITYTK